MLFRLIIIIFFNALALTALSVKASADCYSASSNTIGSSGQCNGMLIVDRTMLDTAIADNSFSITGPDGNLYTFADSAYNIFTGQMTSLYGLFRDKTSFNADIGYWDVSNVTDMTNMFRGATSFNQNIGSWDVSGVVYLDSTFRDASSFNQSLNSWDVSSATHLGSTFKGATDFNGDLSSWDISNVDYAWYTFQDATSFNQNIGGWDTSGVSSLMYMFSGASSFNQNIGSWDVSNVNSFTSMFANATSFNQNLTPWEVSSFDAEPSNFASGAVSWALSKRPLWGIPQLSSSSPADDATGVVVNSNIVLTFNKDVTAGSGSIKLYNINNILVQEFNVLSDVTFLGTAVRINPTSDFDSSQSYYVQVETTAINDLAGNAYAGISDTTTLSFTAADIAAPTLASSSPADDATGVAVNSNIVLTFNENVQAGTGNITLFKSDNTQVEVFDVTTDVTISGATVTLDPAAPLDSLQGYYVQVASTAIQDTSNNAYAGISDTTTLSFTAADIAAPTLASSSPADDATGVAVNSNIVLTFNENVQAGTGNITLFKSDNTQVEVFDVTTDVTISGATVTLDPASDLESLTGYYIQIAATAIDDTSNNSYSGVNDTTTLSFTAASDSVAPILVSTSPADDATGVAVNSNIVLTFHENIQAGTGNITLFKSDDTQVEVFDVTTDVTISGATVTLDPASDLDSLQGYYVQVASTAIQDTSNNAYAGISDETSLSFTTLDIVAPTLASTAPADDDPGINVDANIVLTFDENVQAGTGNITLFKSDNTQVEVFDVTTDVTISGATVTLDPASDLESSQGYYVQIAATAIDDPTGNSYAGISDTTTLSFTADDIAGPTLASSSPADDATGVAVNSNIVLTFNETVQAGTGNITLFKSDNTQVEVFDVTTDVTISGATVTLDPASDLESSQGYYVQVASTAIQDTSSNNNAYAGISDTTTLSFTAADIAAPTLASSSPADDATGVAVNSNIVLTFNETVQAGTGNITLFKSDNTQVEVFDVTTDVTISGATVTLDPAAPLDSLQGYYVQVASTAIQDTSNNAYAGISDTTTLSFTAADIAAPTLASSSPADDATGVAVNSNIVLTFNETVQAGTGNITLFKSDNTQVEVFDVTTDVTISGATVTLDPASDLDSATTYFLHVGASAIEDTSANPYAGISNSSTLNFTSIDNIAPTLASSSPADDATGVAVNSNIVLTFNENVQAGTGDIKLYKSDNTLIEDFDVTADVTISGATVTLDPASDLDSLQGYYMKVESTAVQDTSNNAYAGISDTTTLSFTAADIAAPTLASSSPADDATGVAVNSNIVLTFNETVQAGTGNITLFKSDNTQVEVFDVTTDVTISGAIVTLNPSANFGSSQGYYVQIAATAIDDTSNNSYSGVNDTTTLSFTAADIAAPTLASSSPTDNATGVAVNSNIVLTFNETVQAGTGNITLFKSDNTQVEVFDVTTDVTISGATVTLDPASDLDSLQGYYVQVASTAVQDTSNNAYAGISDTTTLSFTTADNSGPTLASSSPADDATGVAVNSNIVLTFNETVQAGTGNITLFKSDNTQVEVFDVTTDVTISGATVTLDPALIWTPCKAIMSRWLQQLSRIPATIHMLALVTQQPSALHPSILLRLRLHPARLLMMRLVLLATPTLF